MQHLTVQLFVMPCAIHFELPTRVQMCCTAKRFCTLNHWRCTLPAHIVVLSLVIEDYSLIAKLIAKKC